MATDKGIVSWTSHHHEYYLIASSNLASAISLQKEIEQKDEILTEADTAIEQYTGRPDARDHDVRVIQTPQIIELLEKQALNITQAVVFSALCIEAFINYYATRKKSKAFQDYMDKLSPQQKWYLIPTLLNDGRSFELGREPLQSLDKLIKLRNRVVHAKPSTLQINGPFNIPEGRFAGPSLKEAKKSVATVRALVEGLVIIDPVVNASWLDNNRPEVMFMNLEQNGKWTTGL